MDFGLHGTGTPATLTSSNLAVAQLMTTSTSGGSVTVETAANASSSPTSVAAGRVALDALNIGTTTVSTEATSFDSAFPQASVEVAV